MCLAINTSIGNTRVVILVVPDAGLQQLITSAALLAQTWPGAWEETMLFIQVLRMSAPSLAEVLTIGLISMLAPPSDADSPHISLACGPRSSAPSPAEKTATRYRATSAAR